MLIVTKTIGDTFIYGQFPDYDKMLVHFMLKGQRINTTGSEFEDILFDVKRRRLTDTLTKVITSNNVVFAIDDRPLPKAFKTFVAKDIQDGSKPKVFIDASDYLKFDGGTWKCSDLNWLMSYVVSGITGFIYKLKPEKLLLDQTVIMDGGDCFVRLFSYMVDRIYKIVSVQNMKRKVDYLCALYYQINLLQKDFSSESGFRQMSNVAKKLSNIDDREATAVDVMLQPEDFKNVDQFVKCLARIFNFKDFKIAVALNTWMQAFGTGTQFGMEFFPAFSTMLTNAYIGGYLNNQNLIEKLCGTALITFSKAVLKIGDGVA